LFFRLHRDRQWWKLHTAATTFGLPGGYTRSDVEVAFRRLARKAHPDMGGTCEAFNTLVAQRELLLTDLLVRDFRVRPKVAASR
jgi:hypothetical protein